MAIHSTSPIADIVPARRPERPSRSEPSDEKFVVPGLDDPRDDERDAKAGPEDARESSYVAPVEQQRNPQAKPEAGAHDDGSVESAEAGEKPENGAVADAPGGADGKSTGKATGASADANGVAQAVGADSADLAAPTENGVDNPATSASGETGNEIAKAQPEAAASKPADGSKVTPQTHAAAVDPNSATVAPAQPASEDEAGENPATAETTPPPGDMRQVQSAAPPTADDAAAVVATVASTQQPAAGDTSDADAPEARQAEEEGEVPRASPDGESKSSPRRSDKANPSASVNASAQPQPGAAGTATSSPSPANMNSQLAAQALATAQQPPSPTDPQPASAEKSKVADGSVTPSFHAEMRAALDAPSQASASTARSAAMPHSAAANQVAVQISRAVEQGSDKLTVHLKPAELGKVTIELDVGPDHRVHATISAERGDTLDLLQRDARALERALNDAGLKADTGSLQFSLQDGTGQTFGERDGNDAGGSYAMSASGVGDMSGEATPPPYARLVADGHVNIQV